MKIKLLVPMIHFGWVRGFYWIVSIIPHDKIKFNQLVSYNYCYVIIPCAKLMVAAFVRSKNLASTRQKKYR